MPAAVFGARARLLALLCGVVALASGCATSAPSDGQSLAAGETVMGAGGHYSFEIPNEQWRRVEPGTLFTDLTGDLELIRGNTDTWLMVLKKTGPAHSLDAIVATRRGFLLASGYTRYRENRRFLERDSLVPASFARYSGGPRLMLVLTAVDGPIATEVLVSGRRGTGEEDELLKMLHTFRFATVAGKEGGEQAEEMAE